MEEIKVGEYVRLKDGRIIKFKKFGKLSVRSIVRNPDAYKNEYGTLYVKTIVSDRKHYKFDNIVKHSPNIIDLIEEGDYVNGILVTGKESTLLWTEIKGIDRSGYHIPISQYGENIKSIVTKEQIENIEYKVEEQ